MIIPVSTTLVPRVQDNGSIRTGFAIIVGHFDTNPAIMKSYLDLPDNEFTLETLGTSYIIVTDFGNVMRITYSELMSSYTLGKMDNIKERFARQKELLREVGVSLMKGEYNDEKG